MTAYPGVAQIRPRPHVDSRWQEHAVCTDVNPNIFFDPNRYDDALAVCKGCPVKKPCAQLGRGQADGVWGGKIHQRYKQGRTG